MPELILNFVYGLTDPRMSGVSAVRYIGVTTNPNQRYQAHLSCSQISLPEKNVWIQDIYQEGLEPGIDIFEVVRVARFSKLALERETWWIQRYLRLGVDLFNIQKRGTADQSVVIEVPSKKECEVSASDLRMDESEFSLAAGTVLNDGTVIQNIDLDGLFDLFLRQGYIGGSAYE